MRRQRDRAFALITVMWVLLLLGLAAGLYGQRVRAQVLTTVNRLDIVQARLAADAGVAIALSMLTRAREGSSPMPTGVACSIDGIRLRLSIQDEHGKIDLNTASETILTEVFAGAGLAPATAGDIARKMAARPSPFRSLDQLDRVAGLPWRVADRAKPALTVWTGRPGIDPETAHPQALAAVERAVGLAGDQASGRELAQLFVRALYSQSPRRDYQVVVETRSQEGAVFVREAVVRLATKPGGEPRILTWRRGSPRSAATDEPAGRSRVPCATVLEEGEAGRT
ncbi:MAG: hypothetical protein ACFB6S_08095 [Geminicoccaceae bacterium]